ncbi:MAG: 3-dehydroquinate synthase [Alphaproteobacteria bacterium]|nr:3-dehydroquinate synthase [Alphaproteobacteria bacterium]
MIQDTVTVGLGDRSYDILVGTGLLQRAGELIRPALRRPKTFVVTDENVAALHLDGFRSALAAAGIEAGVHVLPAGEQTKSFRHLEELIGAMLDARLERRDRVIALGGGVIGDLTGFAASILRRGIGFIQVPTTLLSQVDSSVGGKTGINTRQGKNLVGTFHQPALVLADTGVLDTLPRRELGAGYAEVLKYGLIRDAAFFQWLEAHGAEVLAGDPAARAHAVATSCRAKADVVAADEFETGERALLNLGHTFGHALEAETGYGERLLHGEGVAIGMVLAFELSARLGLCDPQAPATVRRHLRLLDLPASPADIPGPPLDARRLIGHMAQDKKVKDGRITFVLARGIGDAFLTSDVDTADVEAMLTDALQTA